MAHNASKAKSKVSLASIRNAFVTLIWPRRKLVLLGLALILVNRLAGLVLPGASKYLIDDVIGRSDLQLLKLLLLAIGIAVIVQSVSSYLLTKLLSVEAQRLIAILRAKIQKHVIRLPLRFFDEHASGALVSRIMNDVEGVRNLVGTGLVHLFGGVLTAIVSVGILLSINATLTLYAFVPVALFAIISMKSFARIRPMFRDRGAIIAKATGRLTESLNGIRVIKGFNAERREEEVFARDVDNIFMNVKKTLTTTSFVTSVATLLMGVAGIVIMGAGGVMIIDQELTEGEFLAFILYLGFLVAPVIQMSNIGTQITEAMAGLDRTEEILRIDKEIDNPQRTITLGPVNGNMAFRKVAFAYEEGRSVLHDITFDAPAGSVTAFVGSSGSGKTTLAGLAASFLTPTSGHITIDGIDLASVTFDSFRSQLGVVLQDEFMFEGTIRENIIFADPHTDEDRLQAAVRAAHVHEFSDRFELGLETVIGERGVKLSGGQRQRVAIARALLADPKILILDEATSSLDAESEAYVQESLALLMQGRTTFVIAHRLSTIRSADQILVIEKGRIVEQGTHDRLIAASGRYHDLYTYQARI